MNQRTLARPTRVIEGVGVHSGRTTRIVCRPAPPDTGIRFRNSSLVNPLGPSSPPADSPARPGLIPAAPFPCAPAPADTEALPPSSTGNPALSGSRSGPASFDPAAPPPAFLPADLRFVNPDETLRRAILRHPAGWSIQTPEHLLSACVGLGISNLEIELSGSEEVPILDGSAKPFAEALEEAGLEDQAGSPAAAWTVTGPVFFRLGSAELAALPSEEHLTVSCFLDFPDTVLGNQSLAMRLDPAAYLRDLAPARTFVLEQDVAALRAAGLIKGGSLDLAVVVGREAYLNPPLRFPDECVRHKIVDLMGDLLLVGGLPRGHFMAFRAGHASHLAFGHFLRKDNRLRWIQPPPLSPCL